MPLLTQGRVLVTNWHVFEPQAIQTGGVGARVTKAGVDVRTKETIAIGLKTTTARGTRYLTLDDLERQVAAGLLTILSEEREKDGALKKVTVESRRYVESDTALVNRILGREVGGKQNILIMNNEAHHAYRIVREERDEDEEDLFGDGDEAEDFFKEATVWVDGLDRIQKLRGINFCLDVSATPYFLGRVGQDTNRPFPCSVGMLTEGWDCNTVTHIIGLRPFMSQLLCEQVVGRASYEVGPGGKLTEEVAKVFSVPFEVIPFKANPQGQPQPRVKRYHVHAVPAKAQFEIKFPRVEGYTQAIRNKVTVDWGNVPSLLLEPGRIPPEVEVKGLHVSTKGKLTLSGPGRVDEVNLEEFRAKRRMQELVFDLANTLARDYVAQKQCTIPTHTLFPQLAGIIRLYLDKKVEARAPADKKDLFLAPYYGWVVERLLEAIRPDTSQGEAPEVPRYEATRGPGSTAEVDFWTSREVREVVKSHLNYVVADTNQWEQSAAYYLDKGETVEAFVKNSGLGFAIPYLHNGQMHDYVPGFIVRLKTEPSSYLILETKGYDPLEGVKRAAGERWVAAVNADGAYGCWRYAMVKKVLDIPNILT